MTGASDFADVDTWIFDLDNTLYAPRYNLFDQVDARIGGFIARHLDLDRGAARTVQKAYFRDHGTTLRGLMLHHDVDPGEFLDFVHDIDVTPVPPSPRLDAALDRLEGRKLVFTNGSTAHAENVMRRLGVSHHFDGIFDIVAADYLPKPDPVPYAAFVARFGIVPERSVLIEDIARNLAPAAALGMTTVWLRNDSDWGRAGSDGDYVDHIIDDLEVWLEGLVGGVGADRR